MTTLHYLGTEAITLYYGELTIAWLPGESQALPSAVAETYLFHRPALFERADPAPVAEEAPDA